MTIHDTHPFADPEPDPVRRFRGRLGGPVSLVTTGAAADRAGLTVSSLMVANGSPARVLLLVDPDSDLADAVASSGTAVVQLLSWGDRDLAEAFAGTAPAPGGPWRLGTFEDTEWGPRLSSAATWAGVRVESTSTAGWSSLLTCVVESIEVGADDEPLISRRGRWVRP
ncbi:flavin reductase [Nocardioides sp. MAH-18]|uniref:Flavin reductase n=1 Tax=Nocardioides agri TaxID=2682843 RepID=A0A6L6XYG3_9ACTN|nr:flavin reductase family protein [Nocardioides sp. CGMCC 1.13656]MBA2952274.1 flavin reductase [Nocardioides sp. CGMCC 1.13656]MVQ51436.1 flavin reductase [Nocardioides sp. MAH-18]